MMYRSKKKIVHALIQETDTVLDIGFAGQGVQERDRDWPHRLLKERAATVYGIDLELPENYRSEPHYQAGSAEDFSFGVQFDTIFAADLIEHLSNPGLFLDRCKRHLRSGGRLILITPNTFNIENMGGKLTHVEPPCNSDHTFYFTHKTLKTLLRKNGWSVVEQSYLYGTEYGYKESWRKKLLNFVYRISLVFTEKFGGGLVVVARAE